MHRKRLAWFIAAASLALAWAGGLWPLPPRAEAAPAPPGVQTLPSRGRAHLRPGERFANPDRFPTSGTHSPTATRPGFYKRPQPPAELVHALEHGNVVIYYDKPGKKAMDALRFLAALYTGPWTGVVVTPKPGMGQRVVLTAWTKKLVLERFDPAPVRDFINAYRGRGPENRVR